MMENQPFDAAPTSEVVQVQRSTVSVSQDDSEEEQLLRLLGRKSSLSPASRSGKRRAVSCTTTTTTTTKWDVPTDGSDVENQLQGLDELDLPMDEYAASPTRPKTPSSKPGNGIGSINVGKRSSPLRRSTDGKTSVRKTSGRIGSASGQTLRMQKSS
jgi:cell division cycle 14